MSRLLRSLAGRVTLLTTIAVGLAVAFVAVGAFMTVRVQLQSTLDNSLLERAHAAAKYPLLSELTNDYQLPSWALGAADVRIAFVYSDGSYRTYDQLPPMQLDAERDVATGDRDWTARTIYAGGRDYRVVAVPAGKGGALVVAQSLEPQQQVLARLGVVMLVFGLLGVVAAGVAGWAVARNGLRPVRRLTSEVEAIARTEDLDPIEVEGDDEVARLATAFNEMLTALAASRDRQRRLVADAGHELRTPLTSLRTNIELLTQADAETAGVLPEGARAELLADVHAQIEELTTLIGDLVELSRDDEAAHVVAPVDLAEVVDQALARVRRRAPGLEFDVAVEPFEVVGDSAALERAVTNLLDNAAKWSPPGGTVTVRLAGGVLTVDDEGPGISEEDRPHVFDRFWRAEESRGMPGSGLGLSIVARVADRHAGTVEVDRSPAGGARFVLTLPAPAPAAPPPSGAHLWTGGRG
ncbi:HAMP domain-containing protein [Nocardioides sp. zg-579]|uniref:histidine kinase n=1 Tax=Nocardioides marmotae TaxID=2663857 RepID=A0A6I3JES0_9ACTN|nr:HAMP domain-containing sensor histidine kinase [Nocardioides marmotae]MCR6033054.1 HAMP domain-containing protein [Gordonia jinghuaiqii]MTB96706.1 HAMP domain-containing protein [Nocardioides marmotae]QKE03081.1 HAMP domain-containing histidine kinase [Nocardioides marmotae]